VQTWPPRLVRCRRDGTGEASPRAGFAREQGREGTVAGMGAPDEDDLKAAQVLLATANR
jgi:hypothetical protein